MSNRPAIESEKMIIGALLLESSLYKIIEDKLLPNDFSDENLQNIFGAMRDIYKKRGTFDMAMIADEMQVSKISLLELASECYSISNISAHADIVREKSVHLRLIDCKKEIENKNE